MWRMTPLALAALLGGCASLQTREAAEAPAYDLSEERAPPGTPTPRVFMMEKNGATIAVFGTTHLIPERLQWLSPATEAALEDSDLILTETSLFAREKVAITDDQAGLLASRSLLPPGRTLWGDAEKRFGPAVTARIKAVLAAHDLNPAVYTAMRPWLACRDLQIPPRLRRTADPEDLAMIEIMMKTYGPPDLAPPDFKVEMFGVANGIETAFLESEYQRADNFSRLGDEDALDCMAQVEATDGARSPGTSAAANYGALLAMWTSGDVEAARAMMEQEQGAISQSWARLFLQGREAAWLPQIARECDEARRNCFVAVGMAHLGGPDGLLKGLETMGYRLAAPQG